MEKMDVLCTADSLENPPSLRFAYCAEKGPGWRPGSGASQLNVFAGENNEFDGFEPDFFRAFPLFLPEYHSVINLLNGFLFGRMSKQEEGAQL
ncbi:MAG: hypothetical protein KDA74_25180, partial [Planctomycetaceae bacterium]|nr:hypothetical protein [Planctomycetaceae bacterium]